MAALLFPWPLFSAHATFNLLYQFWIHTQLIPPLPLVETVFNTPSLHRIHHGRNIRALGKNYGAILIIWDRMFGTYEPEICGEDDPNTPLMYGIIPQLRSYNPIFANVHHFYHMLVIQTKWQKWWEVPFRHWTPKNAKCPEVSKKSKMNPMSKFDPTPPTLRWKVYALGQFTLLLVFVSLYLLFDDDDAISEFLFPDLDLGWGKAFIAITVFSVSLWTLSNVSSICTLGVEGTKSTRRSLLCSEGVRHAFILLLLIVACLVPSSTSEDHRLFLTIAAFYFILDVGFFFMLRTDLEEEEEVTSNIVFADTEALICETLIGADMDDEVVEKKGVSNWTWYGAKKYQ